MQRVIFDKGFKPQDLEKGIEFEVESPENDGSDDSEEFYDERFDGFRDEHGEPNFKTTELSMPFNDLKQSMTSVTEDGCVKKQTLKWGTGIVIPEKSVVIMHYDAFLDKEKVPFDSTRLRNRPFKFLFGDGNIIPGLEMGIQTMKRDEIARIYVSSEYAFGAMGCPPRIPENADIIYVVEIINFFESKDSIEFEEMTPDEQKKAPFEKVVAVFHCEHQVANDLFRSRHYKPAIARYRKMVRILEDVSVENEQDDLQRNGYLLKLYLNLCLCYININNSEKAIIYGRLALGLDNKNPKAMYRLGSAYLLADEFDQAKLYFLKAKEHRPFQTCVHKQLVELERRRKEHQQWESNFCKKMFATSIDDKQILVDSPETKEFRNVLREQFKKFLDSEDCELSFSAGYNDWQIDIVKELSDEYNLAFVSKIYYDQKIIKAVKK